MAVSLVAQPGVRVKDYPKFRVSDERVVELLSQQRAARLITIDESGWPRVGLHVYIHRGLDVEFHLVKDDPHLDDVKRDGRATIEVDEVMASAPSYWIDEVDASHADQFYRCAVIRGVAELTADPAAVATHLTGVLRRYQPEGRHAEVGKDSPLYAGYLARLVLVRVKATTLTTKFKLAQRTDPDIRQRIVGGLVSRGSELDRRTAAFIEALAPKT